MKSILLMAASLGALVPASAFAEQTPRQLGPDQRIREVNYTDGNVIKIRSGFRTATQIEFAPGEVIKFVAMGDTVSWEVAPADNSLFVKPRERAGVTNLIVVTEFQGTKRNYTFELTAVAGARATGTFFKVRLRYPEYEAQQAVLATQQAQLAAALAAQNGAVKVALDLGRVADDVERQARRPVLELGEHVLEHRDAGVLVVVEADHASSARS